MRQRVRGLLGRLFQHLRGTAGARAIMLPTGEAAERWGEREADLLLAWAEDDTHPLDEARIRARWPRSKRLQAIGPHLFLVAGIVPRPPDVPGEPPPREEPRLLAEHLLASAQGPGSS